MGRDKLITFQMTAVTAGKGIFFFLYFIWVYFVPLRFFFTVFLSHFIFFILCLSSSLILSRQSFGTNSASELFDTCYSGLKTMPLLCAHPSPEHSPLFCNVCLTCTEGNSKYFLIPQIKFIRSHYNRWTQSIRDTGPISRLKVPVLTTFVLC